MTPGPLADALRDALAPLRYEAGGDLPVSFSVEVAQTPDRLHRLQWGRCSVLRTPDARRLVEGLLRHLQVATVPRPGTLRLRVASVVTPAGVVLLPDGLRRDVASLGRRLAARGVHLTDGAVVDVDLASGEAEIPGAIELERDELDAVAAGLPRRRDDHPEPPGRHHVRSVLTDPWASGEFERLSWLRAHLVGADGVGLEQLRTLEGRLPLVQAWFESPKDVARLLLSPS